MKLQIMSDLHLEFDPSFRVPYAGADVLILSGDICVADTLGRGPASPHSTKATEWRSFFKDCADNFDHVIYVMGNHESYHGRVDKTVSIIKETLSIHENIHVLDNEKVQIDDFLFLGTTLWTDINKMNPITESIIQGSMNDFRYITFKDRDIYRKLIPYDTAVFHKNALNFIQESCKDSEKVIVCGHHAPSYQSVHPNYQNDSDYHINFAYNSNLENFIAELPQIKLWTHGHVHDSFDYMIGGTRVVCNPKGYYDQNKYFEAEKVFEV